MDGLTRVSVASAEKNYHDGDCGDRDLEEAAHLKRVVGASFGRNSTDVLFEWPAKNFVLMGRDCLARGNSCRQRLGDSGTDGTLQMLAVGRQHEALGSERGMRASYVKLAPRPDFLKDSTSRPKKMKGALESVLEDAFLLSRSWRSSSLVCFSGFRGTLSRLSFYDLGW